MGLFDYVSVSGPAFVCSEGHDLSGQEFQTKDLGCTMGSASIGDRIDIHDGGWGDAVPSPFTGTIEIYAGCRECPAMVQAGTFNTHQTCAEFEVTIVAGEVREVRRTSPSAAEQMTSAANAPWMHDGRGPMTYADAKARQRDRKFFPWDPVPVVSDDVAAAQRKWRAEIDEREAKRTARLAATK